MSGESPRVSAGMVNKVRFESSYRSSRRAEQKRGDPKDLERRYKKQEAERADHLACLAKPASFVPASVP